MEDLRKKLWNTVSRMKLAIEGKAWHIKGVNFPQLIFKLNVILIKICTWFAKIAIFHTHMKTKRQFWRKELGTYSPIIKAYYKTAAEKQCDTGKIIFNRKAKRIREHRKLPKYIPWYSTIQSF